MTTITANEIQSFVRKSVREEISVALMEIRAALLPTVSQKEAAEVSASYGKPTRKVAREL